MKNIQLIKITTLLAALAAFGNAHAATDFKLAVIEVGVDMRANGSAHVRFNKPLTLTCNHNVLFLPVDDSPRSQLAYETFLHAHRDNRYIGRVDYEQDAAGTCRITTMRVGDQINSSVADAALRGSGSGKVTNVRPHWPNVFMFGTEVKDDNLSGCSSAGARKDWAVDISTEDGRAMMSTVLTAFSQRKAVIVKGAGLCDAWGDRERPLWVYVGEN